MNDHGNESYDEASDSAYIARAKAHAARIAADNPGSDNTHTEAITAGIEWAAAELRATRLLEQEQLA
jgi:hypothetical protein